MFHRETEAGKIYTRANTATATRSWATIVVESTPTEHNQCFLPRIQFSATRQSILPPFRSNLLLVFNFSLQQQTTFMKRFSICRLV